MSDRAALLAAICEHPDEEVPRLVYADWLDENGGSKRAAFIRARVEHRRLTGTDTEAAAMYRYLGGESSGWHDRLGWARVDDGLRALNEALKAARRTRVKLTARGEGVPRVPGVSFSGDDGGFFSQLQVTDVDAFLRSAGALFRAAPITRVAVEGLTAEAARELVAAGHLKRIRELELDDDVDSEAVRVLGGHRDVAGVRVLALWGCDDAADLMAALAAGKHWTGLEELELLDIDGESGAAAELLQRRQFRGLRRLEAWGNDWGNDVARAAATNLPELRYLDLAINSITGPGAAALAESRTLTHLRTLDLSSCDIASGEGTALITTPNLPSLTVLRLDSNSGQTLSKKALGGSGRGPGLRALQLDRVESSGAALEALSKCSAIRGLWDLSLSNCGLTDESLEALVRHAGCDHLTQLDLSHNKLTARSARALATWPGAASLRWLNLSGNALGESGAKALIASPYLKGLKSLSASGRGVAALKAHFKKVFA
jgi:uncharacterized protein (TIGR02996 family)